ncbi:G kinase-anchoring protein 1-like [Mytilus trossulus]|uniref:G kinase-anchoring protein 1-like n=1 Tax=Mytilus trossulus TaxID=6551 RepID=UPI003007B198
MQHEAVLSNERTSNESTKRRKHKRKKKRERSSTTEKNSLTSDERVTDRTEKSQTSLQNEACTLVNKHSSTNKENSKDELPEKVHSDHSQTNDLSEKSVDHEDSLADDVDKSKKIVKKEEHVESRRSIADDSISSNSIQNETFAGLNNNSRLLESAMNGVSDATPSTSRETRKGNDSSRHDLTENSVQTLVENKMENIKQELQKVRKELMDYNNVTNQVRVDMSGLEENMKLDTKHHAKQIEEKLMNQTTQLQQGLTQLEEIIKKSTQTEEVLEHIKANRNKIDDQKQEIKDMKNTLLKLQEDISRLLNLQSERENLSKTIKEDSNTQSTPQTENLPSSSTVQNITNQTDIDNRVCIKK